MLLVFRTFFPSEGCGTLASCSVIRHCFKYFAIGFFLYQTEGIVILSFLMWVQEGSRVFKEYFLCYQYFVEVKENNTYPNNHNHNLLSLFQFYVSLLNGCTCITYNDLKALSQTFVIMCSMVHYLYFC